MLIFVPALYMTSMPASTSGACAEGFTSTIIDGRTFSLQDYRGKVVLLDFMATWCNLCYVQNGYTKLVQKQFPNELTIISISTDPSFDTEEVLKDYLQEECITWPQVRDTTGLWAEYGITGLPTLILVDEEGKIVKRYVGVTTDEVLIGEIRKLL